MIGVSNTSVRVHEYKDWFNLIPVRLNVQLNLHFLGYSLQPKCPFADSAKGHFSLAKVVVVPSTTFFK